MNGFRIEPALSRREQQDQLNEQMATALHNLTRVIKGHETKILELEARIATLEGEVLPKPTNLVLAGN